MITGVLLAVARISGETAPLLFTALNNQFWSTNLNAPMASLPVVIFQFALSPYEDWQQLAWTGALIITIDRAGAQHHRARARRTRENSHERTAMTSPFRPSRTPPVDAADARREGHDPRPQLLLRRQPRAEGHHRCRSTRTR